jgi:formate dehydrogenase major subunit
VPASPRPSSRWCARPTPPTAASPSRHAAKIEVKRTVCTHCSVGCAVDAVVENGVWVRQEPVFDSPISMGGHCAKGAALRDNAHGEYRLKYPMKLVNGKYERISWDVALTEISARMLELRKESGPDSIFIVGSCKSNNEQGYLLSKWMSLWGSNNCDHQARICHSTTVAGVANTWGYGAMTNSYNDMRNAKAAIYLGSNAARRIPVSLLHMLHAKEKGCKMIVVDPRFTRTAAKADHVRAHALGHGHRVPVRRDVPHLQERLGRQEVPRDRVYGMDKVREEVLADWTPDKVTEVSAASPRQPASKVAKTLAENRPARWCGAWVTGPAQHRQCDRARLVPAATGSGQHRQVSGGGANIFRGHDNVQGITDIGPNPDSLPGYYGIAEGCVQALRGRLGCRFRLDQAAVRAGHDDQARHDGVALV